jgi:hypothetical protein
METMYNIHVAVLEIIHNLDIFPLIVNINEHSNTCYGAKELFITLFQYVYLDTKGSINISAINKE